MGSSTNTIDGLTFPDRPDLAFADQWEGWHKFLGLKGPKWARAYHYAAYRLATMKRGMSADFVLNAGPAAERRFKDKPFKPSNRAETWVSGSYTWARIEAVAKAIYERGAVPDAQVRKIAREAELEIRQAEAGG